MKTVLTIAGLDPTSGAGLQSDVLTLYAQGVYPLSVPTSVTGQNSKGVFYREDLSPEAVIDPLRILLLTHTPDAIKIGMMGQLSVCEALYRFLKSHYGTGMPPIVLDPVLISSSGKWLVDSEVVDYIREVWLKDLYLITPNIDEAKALFQLTGDESALEPTLREYVLPCNLLLKGGHLENTATDYLKLSNGKLHVYRQARIDAPYAHGTGCTLSSAIAANLALGYPLEHAVQKAKNYLLEGLRNPIQFDFGGGAIRK